MGRANVSVTPRFFTSIRKRQEISLKEVVSRCVLNAWQGLTTLKWQRASCRNFKSMTGNCFIPTLKGKQTASLLRWYIVPHRVAHHSVVKTVDKGDACSACRQSSCLVCWTFNSSQKKVLWIFKASRRRCCSSALEFVRVTTHWSPGLSLSDLVF